MLRRERDRLDSVGRTIAMRVGNRAIDAGAGAAPGGEGATSAAAGLALGVAGPGRRSQASAAVDAYPRQDELRSQPAIADSLAGRQARDHRVRIIPKNSSGSQSDAPGGNASWLRVVIPFFIPPRAKLQ